MNCWSTVLVLMAFLIGAFMLEGVAARNTKGDQRKHRLQTSRTNHGRYRKATTNPEGVSSVPFKAFSVNMNESGEDLVNFNSETVWQNGSSSSMKIPLRDLDLLNTKNESQLEHVVEKAPIHEAENQSFAQSEDFRKLFSLSLDHQPLKRRLKRLIFGRDGRIRLNTSTQTQKFPFSATVKISTGCSGSLISHKHVLTSAHCLHNGTRLLAPIANLKVGFLRRNGKFRWIGVDNINFPESWRLEHSSPSFDYAVMTLRKAHKRPFFTLGVIKNRGYLKLHFASFPGDKKSNSLWYSHCYSQVKPSLLIGRCDATAGSSGAGTYVRTTLQGIGKHNRVVVGILSGSGRVQFRDGRSKLFNLVTKLTNLKVKQICRWTGSVSGCISRKLKSGVSHDFQAGRLRTSDHQ